MPSRASGATIAGVEKAKSVKPIDISPEGTGLVVETNAGEIFVPVDDAAEGLAELGWVVVTPPRVGVGLVEPKPPGKDED